MKQTLRILLSVLLVLIPLSLWSKDLGYDPAADPFANLDAALAQAESEGKFVLIISGGEWCHWCHVLERYIKKSESIREGIAKTFVIQKVYIGEENLNRKFFSHLPDTIGVPHFWVVAPDRRVLLSMSPATMEDGKGGYDRASFMKFIDYFQNLPIDEEVIPAL